MLQYLLMATVALLLGGECTGKTALARALADSVTDRPVVIVQEALRSFVDHHKRTPTRSEQRDLWDQQRASLREAMLSTPQQGLVICDPAPLMTAVYSLQYFNDHSLLQAAMTETQNSDLIIWCAPDIPWEADGLQRDGADARERTHALLKDLVVPQITAPIAVVSGDIAKRLQHVRAQLR
jgi:nicotinamide riboside kinase